jgi:hypothetical protein
VGHRLDAGLYDPWQRTAIHEKRQGGARVDWSANSLTV